MPMILNLPEQNQPEEAARLAAVFRWLNEHSGWLLILDNADTPEAAAEVEKTLPKLQGGGVIITSRIADWSTAVQTTELDVLGEEDAAAFLLERTELATEENGYRHRRCCCGRARTGRPRLGSGTSGRLRREEYAVSFSEYRQALGVA